LVHSRSAALHYFFWEFSTVIRVGFQACDFSRRDFLSTGAPFLGVCCCTTVFQHRSAVTQAWTLFRVIITDINVAMARNLAIFLMIILTCWMVF
jgi:hypothetical protein